jgi:GNAT superfamily N-acetyltransferase
MLFWTDDCAMVDDYHSRMIRLAEEVFHVADDPRQLAIDEDVIGRLLRIHPAAMQEHATEQGPVAWAIVIPTTWDVMNDFISGAIGERELLDRTPMEGPFDAVYLCSALVLPEFRRQGLARTLLSRAVEEIRTSHQIEALFSWPFSEEGSRLSSRVAGQLVVPLFTRRDAGVPVKNPVGQ